MAVKYKNDPIHEALCEFRFASPGMWNLTIPGRMHDRLSAEYSGEPREVKKLETKITAEENDEASVAVQQSLDRVQLPDAKNTKILAVGPGVLSIHSLAPYDGWKNFKPRILTALTTLFSISGEQPVTRIGLRYINRVAVEQPELDPKPYFSITPFERHPIGGNPTNFGCRVEYLLPTRMKLVVTYSALPKKSLLSEFVLDLDVIWDLHPLTAFQDVAQMIEQMHAEEGKAFEVLITNEARRIFNGA